MTKETEIAEAAAARSGAAGGAGVPPTAEAMAGKARDLQALRDAVVDAASVGAGNLNAAIVRSISVDLIGSGIMCWLNRHQTSAKHKGCAQ